MRELSAVELELVAGGWGTTDFFEPLGEDGEIHRDLLAKYRAPNTSDPYAAMEMFQSDINAIEAWSAAHSDSTQQSGLLEAAISNVRNILSDSAITDALHNVLDALQSGQSGIVGYSNVNGTLVGSGNLPNLCAFRESDFGPHITSIRHLTENEIIEMRDYTHLTDEQLRNVTIKFTTLDTGGAAVTFGNTIYFPSSNENSDFTQVLKPDGSASVTYGGWLVHELEHVYQYSEFGVAYVAADELLHIGGDAYIYGDDLESNTPFRSLSIEAQASVMQDIYFLEHNRSAEYAGDALVDSGYLRYYSGLNNMADGDPNYDSPPADAPLDNDQNNGERP